ncbi:MAG: phosphatidylserine decarboxylase [bacterium]|nr:phosphatidylserine decarboxylase [bacterium]
MSNLDLKKTTMAGIGRKVKIGILVCILFAAGISIMAKDGIKKTSEYSRVVLELKKLYESDRDFANLLDRALSSAVVPPEGWGFDPADQNKIFNWQEKSVDDVLTFFNDWCTFVPNPHNGLIYYELFYGLCYENESALKFVGTEPGLSWTRDFVIARGTYMDSEDSITGENMDKWFDYLGDNWDNFKPPHPVTQGYKGYKTFNEFFIRELKTDDKRPVASPDDDHILVTPADGVVNIINSNLSTESLIHTKYDEYLNVEQLLDRSKFAKYFIGGTAISVYLSPPDYHHYHSPAAGSVVESKEVDVEGLYFGMDGEFFTWSNNGNTGGYKSNFGIFGLYHRGYYIIKTNGFGYIAMIPIGLDDISSVNFEEKFRDINPRKQKPVPVEKGDRLGHFAYGGSTVLLLFQPGVLFGLKANQGNQIGEMNAIPEPGTAKSGIPTLKDYYRHKKKSKKNR